MCYPKPGPRCPSSALMRLKKAKRQYDENPTLDNKIAYEETVHAFYLTTVGIDHLKSKLAGLPEGEEKDQLDAEIAAYEKEREERIVLSALKFDGNALVRDKELTISINRDPDVDPARYIDSVASLEEFANEVKEGYISVTKHPDPDIPYLVLDYTPSTTYSKRWNDATLNARGLIVNYETGEIIARPFTKFFNDNEVNEHNEFPRTGPVVVSNKEDGSMGTLYFTPDGTPNLSTRGSMRSTQAMHASEIYQERYHGEWEPDESKTYVFEVIYPNNRIVLDYGDKDDLVLIGAIDKASGKTVPLNELDWPGEKAEVMEFSSYEDALQADIPDDKEGYVVHFTDSDKRVKLKGAEYIKLHKIMTNMTKIAVWDKVKEDGGLSEDILKAVPEEFRENLVSYQKELQQEFDKRMKNYQDKAQKVREKFNIESLFNATPESRKAVAQHVQQTYPKSEVAGILSIVTGYEPRRLSRNIWLSIRPKASK